MSQASPHEGTPVDPGNPDRKRRRVTRACDVCRRKKVKCDGKQPCIHCTVYSYRCSYDDPNIRNTKNPGLPTQSDSSADFINLHRSKGGDFGEGLSLMSGGVTPQRHPVNGDGYAAHKPTEGDAQKALQVLFPRLNIPQRGVDVYKLTKIAQYLKSKNPSHLNINEISDLYLDGPTPAMSPVTSFDPPSVSSNDGNPVGREIRLVLPPKDVALQLIYTTWNKACVLFRFYHRPSLLEEVEFLYSMDPANYTDRQQKFLPFLYSILACGSLFSRSNSLSKDNDSLEDDGFNYFLEARKLIDITNVGDISSIQTIVMMIMYLQCSARLSTCYLYIGIAMRSALKEGLHRNLSIFQSSKRRLDPIEIDTRKRLFFTIYKMDIYINSLLGLPRSVNEDEFDQEFPEELDDENVTREGLYYEQQNGRLSSSGCANHHTKLMMVMSHVVKELYPIKLKNTANKPDGLGVHERVTKLEIELKAWLDNLPPELQPTDPSDLKSGQDIPEKFVLANFYLHLAFLNCSIMLYRPFIHYISSEKSAASDPKSLIRGRNCIKVARMVVKLANKMIDKDLLVGTYWFSMYTIFFSIACLIYYYHFANYNNQAKSGANYAGVLFDDDLDVDKIKRDIEIGKRVLDCLKNNSNASMRIYKILNNLFEQLNRHTAASKVPEDQLLKGAPGGLYIGNSASDPTTQTVFGDTASSVKSEHSPLSDFQQAAAELHPPGMSFESSRERKQVANEVANRADMKSINNILQDGLGENAAKVQFDPVGGFEPPPESSTSETDMTPQEAGNGTGYKPGVFDQLDAQIFGRILPPYMLEQNARSTQQQTSNLGDFSSTALPEDFSFFGDGAPLDYLDPFNPPTDDSKSS